MNGKAVHGVYLGVRNPDELFYILNDRIGADDFTVAFLFSCAGKFFIKCFAMLLHYVSVNFVNDSRC